MLNESIKQADSAPEGKRGDLIDWREDAACRGYPYKRGEVEPWDVPESKQAKAPALQICWEVCPVRETCLERSLERRVQDVHSIRGGHTALEIRGMIRKRAKERRADKQAAAVASKAA